MLQDVRNRVDTKYMQPSLLDKKSEICPTKLFVRHRCPTKQMVLHEKQNVQHKCV